VASSVNERREGDVHHIYFKNCKNTGDLVQENMWKGNIKIDVSHVHQ
jgi:hypothetical protein